MRAATWIVVFIFCAAFWSEIGYGISRILTDTSKPKVVCNESKPEPHIGSAIVCYQKP